MTPEYLDLSRQVLDRQVVDSNHFPCGRVDDIELDGQKVTAILIGVGAASDRLPELAKWFVRLLFGKKMVRVPWSEVFVITHQIKLRSRAADLGLDERNGRIYDLISRLPLAWKK
jgi:sporulation protein YlmC with PRC-barrel domain